MSGACECPTFLWIESDAVKFYRMTYVVERKRSHCKLLGDQHDSEYQSGSIFYVYHY